MPRTHYSQQSRRVYATSGFSAAIQKSRCCRPVLRRIHNECLRRASSRSNTTRWEAEKKYAYNESGPNGPLDVRMVGAGHGFSLVNSDRSFVPGLGRVRIVVARTRFDCSGSTMSRRTGFRGSVAFYGLARSASRNFMLRQRHSTSISGGSGLSGLLLATIPTYLF